MVSDASATKAPIAKVADKVSGIFVPVVICICLLYTSDAADEEDSVDLGGSRIIKKKKHKPFKLPVTYLSLIHI